MKLANVFTVTTLALTILKLFDVITWSWWWVLSPLYISIGFILLAAVFIYVAIFIKNKIRW